MKFIYLFFLFLFASSFQVYSASYRYAKVRYYTVADTIIKLDTVKDRKLLRKKPIKKPIFRSSDTVEINGVKSLTDTSKKPKPDELQSQIKSKSDDSSHIDPVKKIGYYYGNARVTYQDVELDADFIRVDEINHLLFASGLRDPKTKRYIGRPIFKQKDDKPLIADSLVFNYITKKGKIYNAASEQDGNFVSGGTAKRLNETEVAYKNVLFSTCDLPYPDTHFGIVITKGIAEKHQIISGPAYLEIEGVPLPLFIPFGFFPKPDHRSSGVILPSFGEDQHLGFFLRDFGYYLGISDYVDLTTMGTYYTKGSFDIGSTAHYLKKYKFQGTASFRYGSHKYGLESDPPRKDFNITWSHSQDPAANPGTTFSASVNAGTSSFYSSSPSQTGYNLQALTQNNLRSSISYAKTWPGSPFNLSVSLGHSQDITRKTITLELPTFSLNMNTLSPFDSKDRIGEQKWYQRITVGYSLQGTNKLNDIPESQLFTANTFSKKLQNGFQQSIPVSLSLNILKYFQFNSSITYHEVDYFQTVRKHFGRGSISGQDTMIVDTVKGFKRGSDYGISTGFSTKIYGIMNFKGKLHAIRHVMSPSVSFQYRPDFSDPSYGYYNTIVSNATIPYPYQKTKYSIFDNNVYGGPGAGKSAGLSFSLDNSLEAKIRPGASDTSQMDKKISILQGLSFSSFYNFLADSMKLSDISFNGRTALFNQKLGINFGGVFHPYVTQVRDSVSNNQIVRYTHDLNRFTWQDGRFPMLRSFNLSTDFNLNSATLFHPANQNNQSPNANTLNTINKAQADRLAMVNSDPNAFVDFNVAWNINVSYSFSYNNDGVRSNISNTLNFSGDVNITPKWKIQYNSGYDIKAGRINTTSLNIYRDLHCWDLSFQWIPFGYYKFYSVDLKVKASILQDLKLSKRKDYYNNN